MAAQYYYLISALPGLMFSSPASMTRAALLDECRRHLSEPDLHELEAVMDGRRDDARTTFGIAWIDGDRQIRNAIVRQRALRLGVDEKKYLKPHQGFRVDAEDAVSDAFSRGHPLDREWALDRFRWSLAEELSAGDPFGLASILAYAVKLDINEHWRSLTPEKGRNRLEEMLEVVGVSSEEIAGWSGMAQL